MFGFIDLVNNRRDVVYSVVVQNPSHIYARIYMRIYEPLPRAVVAYVLKGVFSLDNPYLLEGSLDSKAITKSPPARTPSHQL